MQIPVPSTYKDRNGTYYFRLRAASNDLKSSTFRFSLRTKDYSRAMDRALFCRHKLNQLLDGRQLEDLKLLKHVGQAIKAAISEAEKRNHFINADEPASLSPAYANELHRHIEQKLADDLELIVSAAVHETLLVTCGDAVGDTPSDEFLDLAEQAKSQTLAALGHYFREHTNSTLKSSEKLSLAVADDNLKKTHIIHHSGLSAKSITIDELVERFLSAKSVKRTDEIKFYTTIGAVLKHLGAYSTTDLTPELVEQMRIALRNAPPKVTGEKIRSFPVQTLLSNEKPWDRSTLDRNKRFQTHSKKLLKYAQQMNFTSFSGLDETGLLEQWQLEKISAKSGKRRAFSQDELSRFFASGIYDMNNAKHVFTVSQYWVPILCALHGFRIGEVTKLRACDVVYEGVQIPYLRVAFEDEIQDAKTSNSVRDVPLHSKAIQLGFLEFVSESKQIGYRWLFPDLCSWSTCHQAVGVKSQYLTLIKKQAKSAGIEDVSSHSFRHTVVGGMRKKSTLESVSKKVVGHSSGVHGEYGDYELEQLANALESMEVSNVKFDHMPWSVARNLDRKWLEGKRDFDERTVREAKKHLGITLANR